MSKIWGADQYRWTRFCQTGQPSQDVTDGALTLEIADQEQQLTIAIIISIIFLF